MMASVSNPVIHFILIVAFIGLVMFVLTRYRNADVSVEEFQNSLQQQNRLPSSYQEDQVVDQSNNNSQYSPSPADTHSTSNSNSNTGVPSPSEETVENNYTPKELQHNLNSNTDGIPKGCFPKDQLNPQDLLPGDANSTWAQVNPAGQGELGSQNFLNAGHHIGVNTVGQTLRNSNMGLRSEPPNPQSKVSSWNQTTIEPDSNRRGLEIG